METAPVLEPPQLEAPLHSVAELDQRKNDGLTVTLWWVRNTMQTFVTVEDVKGDNFAVDVPEGGDALHYFNHPMVYSPSNEGPRRLYAATESEQ